MALGRESDWNEVGHRQTLAGLIASLPDTIIVARDDAHTGDVDAFFSRPVPRSIRGRTESRLFCRLSAGTMLIIGLSAETVGDIVARGCGELVPDGILVRLPTTDEELGACWDFIRQAHETVSAGSGVTRPYLTPVLPNFSRTRLQ